MDNSKCMHIHIHNSYKETFSKVKSANKNRSKTKIRINELHETDLAGNKNNRIVKRWFLESLFKDNILIEIYYVYYKCGTLYIDSEIERYKLLCKELITLLNINNDSQIIFDLCLDNHGNIKQRENIKNYIVDNFNIKDPNQVGFADSQGNCGLQAIDNVIGTIRRKFHNCSYDKKNYELIEPFIKNSYEIKKIVKLKKVSLF